MSNLLKTELYKLFHSWYFWGIGIFNLLLSSILLLDSKECSSNLIMASLYNIPLLYFLIIVFIALFIGSDFSGRTLNTYIAAGHKRSSIFSLYLGYGMMLRLPVGFLPTYQIRIVVSMKTFFQPIAILVGCIWSGILVLLSWIKFCKCDFK